MRNYRPVITCFDIERERDRPAWCNRAVNLRNVSSAFVVILAIACTSPANSAAQWGSPSPSTGGYLGSLGAVGCKPAAFDGARSDAGLHEVGLESSRGSFWALFFSSVPPPAGKEVKVVWRMTGSGDFRFRVSDSDGKTIPLTWGPEGHGSSSWSHPGNEVGTGFKFPHAGCWDIHVAKADVDADLWLEVAG